MMRYARQYLYLVVVLFVIIYYYYYYIKGKKNKLNECSSLNRIIMVFFIESRVEFEMISRLIEVWGNTHIGTCFWIFILCLVFKAYCNN